jgi:hypothetical protein
MDALARQLVAFDRRLAEEVAEHLRARADRLATATEEARGVQRRERFAMLAELLENELERGTANLAQLAHALAAQR